MPKRPRERLQGTQGKALDAVKLPATALQLTGGLALGISIIAVCLFLYLISTGAGGGNGSEENSRFLSVAIVGVFWGGIVLVGGSKMKKLESRGYAVTAATIALLPCNACWLLGAPCGLWALVVLNRPEVKSAFR